VTETRNEASYQHAPGWWRWNRSRPRFSTAGIPVRFSRGRSRFSPARCRRTRNRVPSARPHDVGKRRHGRRSRRIDYMAPTPVKSVGGVTSEAIVVEYDNTTLGHFFITSEPAEAAMLDAGIIVPGWQAHALRIQASPGGERDRLLSACPLLRYPTVWPELAFLHDRSCGMRQSGKRTRFWTYEGLAFNADPPAAGNLARWTASRSSVCTTTAWAGQAEPSLDDEPVRNRRHARSRAGSSRGTVVLRRFPDQKSRPRCHNRFPHGAAQFARLRLRGGDS